MKILHVISSLDARQGGPPAALVGLAPAQVRAGLDVTIAYAVREDADRSLEPAFEQAGVKLIGIGPATGALLRHPDMAAAIASGVSQADVVHIHALWEEIQHLAAGECQKAAKPYVVTPHGMLTPWSLKQKWLKKQVYLAWCLRRNLNRATAIHCASVMEARAVEALRLGPETLVEPFGLDLEEFRTLPSRGMFRAKFNIAADCPLVVFLGRVHPGKGVELLLPAASRLSRKDVMIAIVGPNSGGYMQQMKALAESYRISDRVIFTGMLRGPEKISALVDADVFALPSEHENFGMSVIEALAAGCPVVISDQVGVGDDLRDSGVATITRLDANDIAAALDKWLENPGMRRNAGEKARELTETCFDQQAIGKRWVEHYRLMRK